MPKASTPAPTEPRPGEAIAVSARYGPSELAKVLGILSDAEFNLRTAGGFRIETGGEFGFSVDERVDADGNPLAENHEQATHEAIALLRKKGYEVRAVYVHLKDIDDTPGELKRFVEEIAKDGRLIEEISVGTPRECEDGSVKKVPVQAYTVAAGGPTPTPTSTP
jgi:hypothetical protein